jgi:hypothetical protein
MSFCGRCKRFEGAAGAAGTFVNCLLRTTGDADADSGMLLQGWVSLFSRRRIGGCYRNRI